MTRRLYGVFIGTRWAMLRNKRKAIAYAKKHGGEVRYLYDDPSISAYDAPTFRVLSDPLPGGNFLPQEVP